VKEIRILKVESTPLKNVPLAIKMFSSVYGYIFLQLGALNLNIFHHLANKKAPYRLWATNLGLHSLLPLVY
jgi:hypothetical protein